MSQSLSGSAVKEAVKSSQEVNTVVTRRLCTNLHSEQLMCKHSLSNVQYVMFTAKMAELLVQNLFLEKEATMSTQDRVISGYLKQKMMIISAETSVWFCLIQSLASGVLFPLIPFSNDTKTIKKILIL